jgi:nucleoid-associated protein YgaU
MEQKNPTLIRYAVTAAIAAVAAGLLVFAFVAPSKDQVARLGAERVVLKAQVGTLEDRIGPLERDIQALQKKNAGLASEADKLRATLAGSEKALDEAQSERESLTKQLGKIQARGLEEKVGTLERDMQALQKKNAELASEADKLRAALAGKEKALDEARSERESLTKQLARISDKMAMSAAEREALARKAAATVQGLDEAKARAAELNKAYETLLKDQKQLASIDAGRRAELERMKKAFEEAQTEVARLTGARGIYTVQTGDYLSKIAEFFYHDGHRWSDILKANSFLISHPDLIYPRMVLIIPQ